MSHIRLVFCVLLSAATLSGCFRNGAEPEPGPVATSKSAAPAPREKDPSPGGREATPAQEQGDKPGTKAEPCWAVESASISSKNGGQDISNSFSEKVPNSQLSIEFPPVKGRRYIVVKLRLKAVVADPKALDRWTPLKGKDLKGQYRNLHMDKVLLLEPAGQERDPLWLANQVQKGRFSVFIDRNGRQDTLLGFKDWTPPWHETLLSYSASDAISYGLFTGLLELNESVNLEFLY